MSKTIGRILIFVALIFLVLFILALLALLDISTLKIGTGPHKAFFESFNCGPNCIKTVMAISLVIFIPCFIAGGVILKKNGGEDTTNDDNW